jgi:hypothetical protein
VKFNGSTGTIDQSYNVTSITKNGSGDYTINFTLAMPDANYAVLRSIDFDSAGGSGAVTTSEVISALTSSVRVTSGAGATLQDVLRYEIAIIR